MSSKRKSENVGKSGKKKCSQEETENGSLRDMPSSTSISSQSQSPDFHLNHEAEVGIIESIAMRNFMCHSSLQFKFGSHVNFIIGNNGSGKSAIMTAIVVGLGGKANVTNRGSSVKTFIKNGKTSGNVTIQLRNRGPDAYKPDVFGDSIIVERLLGNKAGYRLMSSNSTVVSTKHEELVAILDHMNIQVDNPLTILNQDLSRNFLHSSNPQDKYKFFLKATQLQMMQEEYVQARESKQIANDTIKQKQKSLPELENEVREWEKRFQAGASVQRLKDKVVELKDELAWALFYVKQRELEPIQRELDDTQAKTTRLQGEVTSKETSLAECQQQRQVLQDELRQAGERATQLVPEQQESKNQLTTRKRQLKNASEEMRKIQSNLSHLTTDRNQICRRIEELQASCNGDQERRDRERKICDYEAKLATIQQQVTELESNVGQHKVELVQLRDKQQTLRSDEHTCQTDVDNCSRRLRELESVRSNALKRYGSWVPELLQKINEAHAKNRFKQKPRGPIGVSLTLRDPVWALAVELCLGGLIHSFCVDNHQDAKVLEQLFSQVCPDGKKPAIIISKFLLTTHDVQQYRPHSPHPTVLETLNIDDPVISNCLIDQRSVECVLLFKDPNEASHIMMKKQARGCREAFTASGDRIYSEPCFRYYTADKNAKSHFLMANLEDDIRVCKSELVSQKAAVHEIRNKITVCNDDVLRNQTELRNAEQRLKKLRDTASKLTTDINELKNVDDSALGDVTTLEEELRVIDTNVTNEEQRQAAARRVLDDAKQHVTDAETELRNIEDQLQAATQTLDPFKENLAKIDDLIDKAKSERQRIKQRLKEHETNLASLRQQHEAKQKQIEADRVIVEQICSQIRTRRTPDHLEAEIEQLETQIHIQEESFGDFEQTEKTYREKHDSYKRIRNDVKKLEKFLKDLDHAVEVRETFYSRKRASLTARLKMFFLQNLRLRDFMGKLNISHTSGTIDPIVQPSSTDVTGTSAVSVRGLSGGERSFSTVCFILSLWDAMESPFRCLDEFDVFMDLVNRRISMDLMLEVTQRMQNCQFLFLSPQDMSHINVNSNSVKIFQMPAPDRSGKDGPPPNGGS